MSLGQLKNRFFNIHSFDQSIAQTIDVVHLLVHNQLTLAVMDDLVHLYRKSAIVELVNLNGLDMRVEHRPLPSPVIAHAFMSMDEAAFPTVRPLNIRRHEGQYRIEVSCVKAGVCGLQDFVFLVHWFSGLKGYSGCSAVIRQMSGRLR